MQVAVMSFLCNYRPVTLFSIGCELIDLTNGTWLLLSLGYGI